MEARALGAHGRKSPISFENSRGPPWPAPVSQIIEPRSEGSGRSAGLGNVDESTAGGRRQAGENDTEADHNEQGERRHEQRRRRRAESRGEGAVAAVVRVAVRLIMTRWRTGHSLAVLHRETVGADRHRERTVRGRHEADGDERPQSQGEENEQYEPRLRSTPRRPAKERTGKGPLSRAAHDRQCRKAPTSIGIAPTTILHASSRRSQKEYPAEITSVFGQKWISVVRRMPAVSAVSLVLTRATEYEA